MAKITFYGKYGEPWTYEAKGAIAEAMLEGMEAVLAELDGRELEAGIFSASYRKADEDFHAFTSANGNGSDVIKLLAGAGAVVAKQLEGILSPEETARLLSSEIADMVKADCGKPELTD